MGDIPRPLRIEHERTADAQLIRLKGEIDLANVDQARQALMEAMEGSAAAVIVDMSELEFIDSVGISMLLEAEAASRRDSNRLAFRGAHDEIARILELTGVDEQIRFVD
jgi:anti-sigma B factor antagonist